MVKTSSISKLTVKDLSINLDNLKQSEGYICIENLNLKFVNNDESVSYIKPQLLARERLIRFLYELLKKYIYIYQKNASFLRFFQYKNKYICKKIKELNSQRKKRERFLKTKRKLGKTVSKFTQTDIDSSYNWDWYYHQYYNYTSEKFQEVGDNALKSAEVKEQLQVTSDRMTNSDNIEQSADSSNMKICISSDSEIRLPDVQTSLHSQKDITEIEADTPVHSNPDSDEKSEENMPPVEGVNECNTHYNAADESSWNAANIKEEVQKLAGEITNKLGYVFIDEIGMYYDHSSGYYYDQNTSLYYDGKTGTYFYFDYDSQKYEFYAQISPNREGEDSSSVDVHCKKLAASSKQDTEKEEGECSDSDDAAEDNEEDEIVIVEEKHEVAPSLRLMIMNGNLKGTLHFVTLDGGSIGREGDVQVLIKDPSVSKVHAKFFYESKGLNDHHYFIQDLGSVNGTTVKGQRLSDSRTPSDAMEIGHGWEIKCGNVILSCHIHPGLLTCNECEPGLVPTAMLESGSSIVKASKKYLEKERRRQNKIIRKKFSLQGSEFPNSKNLSYRDRAGARRETVGSDNPYEKTEVASIDTNISRSNKGFKLLEKMGWSEGQCLGVNDTGPTEPIIPVYLGGRTGLGATPSFSFEKSHNFNPNNSKTDMLHIMKEKSKLMSSSETPPIDASLPIGEFQRIQFTPSTQIPESS